MLFSILNSFGLDSTSLNIQPFGSGLINLTWKVKADDREYILQKINSGVFKAPMDIAFNIRLIGRYLLHRHPQYLFVKPIPALNGEDLVYDDAGGYYRIFPFIKGSHSKNTLATACQAYEAAKQFGKFTSMLAGFNASALRVTLPGFHDLVLRYHQFSQALEMGNKQRIAESAELITFLKQQCEIVAHFNSILANGSFKLRVTHHDTKISNVLFDETNNGLCVIDLDTVMPGYFISDVGDMMRTYLSSVDEEEKDFSKISIREDFYKAIVNGYYSEMQNELTVDEGRYFFFAGTFIIFMQALRFITDYINNDVYYGAKYATHNLVRAGNQATLLRRLLEKEKLLGNYLPE